MKYLTLVILSSISTYTYADTYIFGGSTHFHGRIVNNSCVINITPQPISPPANHFARYTTDSSKVTQKLNVKYTLCTPQLFHLIDLNLSNMIGSAEITSEKESNLYPVFTDTNSHIMQILYFSAQASHSTAITIAATYP